MRFDNWTNEDEEQGYLLGDQPLEMQQQQVTPMPTKVPGLLESYRRQMEQKQADVDEAKKRQEMVGYVNVAGNILNDFNNSQKRDVVLINKMSALGNKPSIIEADRPKYDSSRSDSMAKDAVNSALMEREGVDNRFKNDIGMQDYQQKSDLAGRMADPRSTDSSNAREYLKSIVPTAKDIPNIDNMSAAQLDKMAPGLYKRYADDEENKIKRMALTQKEKGPQVTIKDEMDLAKNYKDHPVTKETNVVSSAYEKIKRAAATPSAAGDLSLIFGYMKMLDPGSTVREGEFATAQNAAGVPTQALNMYNRALNGERLAPAQRQDFINQAGNIYEAQMGRQAEIHQQFSNTAAGYGLDAGRAFGPSPGGGSNKNKQSGHTGRQVNVNGIDYEVGEDGDTLIPLK
jgi:hypothetical protein